jgi:hypothetical protein
MREGGILYFPCEVSSGGYAAVWIVFGVLRVGLLSSLAALVLIYCSVHLIIRALHLVLSYSCAFLSMSESTLHVHFLFLCSVQGKYSMTINVTQQGPDTCGFHQGGVSCLLRWSLWQQW